MADTKPAVFHEGEGRTKVSLSAQAIGNDLLVRLFNEEKHIGAVALSEYHRSEQRASTSVLTRYGHKDDTVAQMAAHKICRHLKIPVCAIAGIHVNDITKEEIEQIIKNCSTLIDRYLESVGSKQCTSSEGAFRY